MTKKDVILEGIRRRWMTEESIFGMNEYYVYIMTNDSGTLYTGVTNNITKRVYQHKNKLVEGFTKKYNINRLVYYEMSNDVNAAISREKQIKGGSRKDKIA